MAELDPAELANVLDSANRYLTDLDFTSAYNLLHPVSEASVAAGAELGRLDFMLGAACEGLSAFDAAMTYYMAALANQTGEEASATQSRIQALGARDAAVAAVADGVAGSAEADAVLSTAWDALDGKDFETARGWFEHAWNGIQMTDNQIARAALGLAECAMARGELDQAEGYLQVAEARLPSLADSIATHRQQIAVRRAGATLGEDGVAMTELDEINQSALQASWNNDYASAKRLFEQMLASDALPATDRGRLHRNVGVMQIYLHDYEGARASFEEAARVGTPEVQSLAQASLAQLDANARAEDIVAGIDLSAN